MSSKTWKAEAEQRLLEHTEIASMLISGPRAVQVSYDANVARATLAAYVLRLGTHETSGGYLDMLELADDAHRRGWLPYKLFARLSALADDGVRAEHAAAWR